MNKYIIPVCKTKKEKNYIDVIMANSITSCKDKFIEKYSDYSDSDDWEQFIEDLKDRNIIVGKITDVEVL